MQEILNRLNHDLDGHQPGATGAAHQFADGERQDAAASLAAALRTASELEDVHRRYQGAAASTVSDALQSAGDLELSFRPPLSGDSQRTVEDILAGLNLELDSLNNQRQSLVGTRAERPPSGAGGGVRQPSSPGARHPPGSPTPQGEAQLQDLVQKASLTRNAVLAQAQALQAKALAAAASASAATPQKPAAAAGSGSQTLSSLTVATSAAGAGRSVGVRPSTGTDPSGSSATLSSLGGTPSCSASLFTRLAQEVSPEALNQSMQGLLQHAGSGETGPAAAPQEEQPLSRSLQELLLRAGVSTEALSSAGVTLSDSTSRSLQELLLSGGRTSTTTPAAKSPAAAPNTTGLSRSIQELLAGAYVEAEHALQRPGLAGALLSDAELDSAVASLTAASSQVLVLLFLSWNLHFHCIIRVSFRHDLGYIHI